MKNLLNFKRLLSYSHEKQKPQRFARYAAMLIMLLTLGVGQMWAKTVYFVNWNDWSGDIYCHNWGTDGTTWPGTKMTNTDHQCSGHTIYSCELKNASNAYCKFHNNGSSATGDLTIGASPMYKNGSWAAYEWDPEFKNGQYIYIKYNTTTWGTSSAKFRYNWNYNTSSYCCNSDEAGRVTGENYAYAVTPNSYVRAVQILRFNSTYGTQWNYTGTVAVSSNTKNCIDLTPAINNGMTFSWTTYAPPVTSIALSHNVSPSGGDGSKGNPYLVPTGTSVTVTATPTNIGDPDITTSYKWDDGSYGSTYTKVLNCSVGGNTYSTTVTCRNAISGTNSTTKSATVYYQAVSDPTITLTSVSPSLSIIAGNDITLVGERANSSNTISFQYTTNDGSTWTDITPKTTSGDSPKTITWTVPDAHGETQTFKFRAKLAEATPIYSDKSSGVSVYNTKTIKVKNTNNWSTMYLHAWNAGGALNGSDWPGKTGVGDNGLSCTNIGGGLWWEVVLTSQVTSFVLHQNVSGNANQTADLAYSSYTDNTCLAISTTTNGDGKRTLPTSTVSCLSAPSVTTSSVTPTVNNAATIGGNVKGLGNDLVTSYGYYYSSTNSSLSGSNLAGATKVQVGTNKDATGTYSKSQTGLTGGTTYYVIAYATNGHSTVYGSQVSFTTPYKVTISNPATGGTFSSTGDKYVSSTLSVTCTASSGYTFNRWTASGCSMTSTSTTSGVTTATLTPSADNATLTAVYDEDMHTVTVTTDGHGTITTPGSGTPRTVSAGIATGKTIAASANTGYTFYNWTKTSGSGTVTFTNANANSTTVKATSDATVRANFVDQWNIKGDKWSSWDYQPMAATANANEYSKTFTLTKGTKYQFKVVKRTYNGSGVGTTDTWYGNTDKAGNKVFERGESAFTTVANGMNNNLEVTADVTGTYTFTIDVSGETPVITVTYPTAYTVRFGGGAINGSDAAIGVSPSFTSGDYVLPETDITFSKGDTKDGYTWKGWYSNTAGTSDAWSTTDASLSLTDTRTGNISVYACYNFITYNITYHLDGGSNHGDNPANFNVETSTITLQDPSKTGYTFEGWYTDDEFETEGNTIAKGTHEDQEFWAKWTANNYTITLNQNGATTDSDPTSLTATYDATAPVYDDGAKAYKFNITNPAKTGYTFNGWYQNTGGTGALIITEYGFYKHEDNPYVDATGHWKQAGDVTVYAKWTPNNYAVTLSTTGETGYGSNAPANQTATYGADMPTITPPVGAPGYKFQGYFTSAGGAGTKYYNANGTSAHTWDIASATTLYAYFLEAEITSLEHETSVAKAEEAELVVNPVLNVVPENYIAICWTLHYADNDNPVDGEHWSVTSYTEGGTKPNQVKFTFINLASGSYYVKATLRKSASAFSNVCTDGTKMMDIHGDFHVVGNNTVTVRYLTTDFGSDFVLKAPTEVDVEAMSTAEITAPEIPGYTFNRWYLGDGISKTSGDYTSATITISATYDGVITARYAKKQMVYFNNTLGWEDVYVYFYNDGGGNQYWADNYGTGANKQQTFGGNKPYWEQHHGHMTQIEGTNIWYFDFKAVDYPTRTKVAFANVEQSINKSGASDDEAYFHNASVVYRTDFDASHLPMFVPINSVEYDYTTNTGSKYYRGYWMNYPESTGYELRFYNKRATDGSGAPYELISKRHKFEFTGDKTLPMSVSLDLEAGHDYYFKIYRVDGTYYGNNNQMTNGHSGDEGQPAWEFKTGTENAWVTASGAGNYTFTLTYGIDLSSNYNYLVGVRYPESTGDFRVLYSDAVRVSTHESDEGKSWLASYVIPKTSESDTVSFFVRKASTPKIKAQKCTATYENETTTVTWTDENEGADLLPDTISADGVYNFIFTKSGDNLVLSAVEPYTGNFYIRVDGAGTSNWDNFRSADHLMPYSDYSFKQEDEPYSHYFTQWYEPNPDGKPVEPKNIKFVVANDYSACVSDTIIRDGIADNYVDANGWLSGRNANIRFMYNYKTNVASRRYIDGAQENGSEFLVLIPEDDDMIFDAETDGNAYSQVTFSDKGNWLYEANVWVVPGTTYKLKSNFGVAPNLVEQYFKGAESGAGEYETLIGGSGSSRLQIRLLYDFKTNRLVSAYIPSSTISGSLAINADVMFIREGQGQMQQLTFENDGELTNITNVYSVLRFNKWTLNNRYTTGGHDLVADPKSIYERSLYFVSFPFDVKLSDVFGFGTYWDEWYIEYYDGAARAKNGFWIDSDSYWKYVTPAMKDTFTLKAGQGYIFGLDLDYLECNGEGPGQQANIWKNIQTADFIFPGNVSSISNSSVTYTLPAHTCTINRGTGSGNRTIADSHWNVLGVPTYLNTTSVTFEETTGDWMTDGKPKYIYSWNPQDNSLSPTSAADFTYHSMNAYVVQYYGNVTFSTSVSPTAAPRRNPEYRGEYEFRLEIQKNDEALDQTYVRLSDDEEVTANFEFGYDLTKAQTGRAANLYTIIEGYLEAAGNTLPLTNQTTIVPVGVKVNNAGDFTFSMPDGTEGIGVTLIDNETGISTQLSALDYTINLAAGTYNNRFILEISPIQHTPTGIDNVQGESAQSAKARKVLIDGILYIVKDGKVFDARGNYVK